MNRIALVASAAALFVTGCGGSPPTDTSSLQPRAAEQSSVTSPSGKAPTSADGGTLVVGQAGTAPTRMLWSLRVEDLTAKPLAEQIFHQSRISFTRSFPTGNYRVIVWSRPCDGTCPSEGETGLGPLKEVCGAQVTLAAGRPTGATAVLATDGSCTIKVAH